MSKETIRWLRARFHLAFEELGAKWSNEQVFEDLLTRYAQPSRHYHTLAHVESCLSWFDRYRSLANRPAEVEIALWFHDAVYDPLGNSNEKKSALLARAQLEDAEVSREAANRVADLVRETKYHGATSGDDALVAAIDLTILGSPPDRYAMFEQQIRREYSHVPEVLFRKARKRVLENLLSLPRIYAPREIHEQLEDRARANLEASVRGLSR